MKCRTAMLLVVLMPAIAMAQAEGEGGLTGFSPGDSNWQFTAGYIHESFGGDNEDIYSGSVGLEYFLWENVAIMPEFIGYYVDQAEDAEGVGFHLRLRWYPIHLCNNRVHPFIDGGASVNYFTRRTPDPQGTHFNFIETVSAGVKVDITEQMSLIGGARYLHLSNAGYQGQDRNPSIDGFGGFLGVALTF